MEAIKAVPEKREGPKEKPSGIGKPVNCVLETNMKLSAVFQGDFRHDQTKVVFEVKIHLTRTTSCFPAQA